MDPASLKPIHRRSKVKGEILLPQFLQKMKSREEAEPTYNQCEIQPTIDSIHKKIQEACRELRNPCSNSADFSHGISLLERGSEQDKVKAATKKFAMTLLIVETNAPRLVHQIFDDWERLKLIVGKNIEILRHRWSKRSVEQKKKVLLEAWPRMSPGHRPDFDALLHGLKGPEHRDAWLMPYINLEDLSKSRNLPMLLETRTSEFPEYFAWIDSGPAHMAKASGAIVALPAFGYTMLLSGQKTRNTYGSLVSWTKDHGAMDYLKTGFGLHVGEGMLSLEIQKRLYHFLVRCTEILLADHDLSLVTLHLSTTLDAAMPTHANSASISSKAVEWTSVTEANTEASYRKPLLFEFENIRKIVSAKRDAAEDEFWGLRENPTYFRDAVEVIYLQYLDMMTFVGNGSWPIPGGPPKHHVDILSPGDIIKTNLKKLEAVRASININPMKPLPFLYEEEVTRFIVSKSIIEDEAKTEIFGIIASSPPLQRFFEVTIVNGMPTYSLRCPQDRNDHEPIPAFLVLLNELLDHRQAGMMGATNILDEVERLTKSDAVQRSMVTATVAGKISELAAFAEISDALNRHQPMIQLTANQDKIVEAANMRMEIIRSIELSLDGLKLADYVQPRSSFDYPSHKKYNQQTVDKLRAAETKLDTFWERVDDHCRKRRGQTLLAMMKEHLDLRELGRTPPWQPPPESEERKSARLGKGLKEASESEFIPFVDNKRDTGVKIHTLEPSIKTKTRGQADPSRSDLCTRAVSEDTTIITAEQTFRLPSKPLRTMRALFPIDRQDHTPGKVLWKDFVQAMYKLGFSIRSMDGSEWYFEPTWKRDAPITFHEPHPSGEIPFVMLRFYANRLARKYGWNSKTFELVTNLVTVLGRN